MINIEFEGDWVKIFSNTFGLNQTSKSDIVEAHISNRQKHSVVAEFGSGIYGDGPNAKKGIILPRKAGALIIPISTKYGKNLRPNILIEARKNAQLHPDILARVKSKMPGVIGFIFRDSMKGMKPIRMVRDSLPKVESFLTNQILTLISSDPSRNGIVVAVNTSAALLLREVVKRSPVLTSNLKTGWTISRFAK